MISEIINNYIINNQVLILILSIFACVLFAIIIIRITLNFLINQAYQKYKAFSCVKEYAEFLFNIPTWIAVLQTEEFNVNLLLS